jgi:hypothetical protein
MLFLIAIVGGILLIGAFVVLFIGENRLPKRPTIKGQRFFKRKRVEGDE